MTKNTQEIVEKIDDRFETALMVNNNCRELWDETVYKFKDIQDDAFTMLSGMLHFGLIGCDDFKEVWDHVVDLGAKYDYHL